MSATVAPGQTHEIERHPASRCLQRTEKRIGIVLHRLAPLGRASKASADVRENHISCTIVRRSRDEARALCPYSMEGRVQGRIFTAAFAMPNRIDDEQSCILRYANQPSCEYHGDWLDGLGLVCFSQSGRRSDRLKLE